MRFREFVSVFLVMVLIISNVNLVFSAESTETDEIAEIQSETEYNDEVVSDSAVDIKLMESSDSDTVIYGDVDNDGDVDEDDVTALRQIILGELTADERTATASDLNSDGSIDINDVTILNKYLAGTYEIDPIVSGRCGDNLTWKLSVNSTLTISGEGDMTDYSSSSPSPWADYCSDITNITIENGVTSIGYSAFSNFSSLTNVSISESVTEIDCFAFNSCTSLTSIIIPDSVITIGDYTFSHCSGLNDIIIPNSVTTVGSYAFSYCTGLTSITMSGVTHMGTYAFQYCRNLTNLEIQSGVTTLSYKAFYYCTSLTSVSIPDSVTSITHSFDYCTQLASINVDSENICFKSEDGILFNKAGTTLIRYPEGKNDDEYTIPNEVTSVDSYSFYNCTHLKSVNISDSTVSIGSYAFSQCSKLADVVISESVTNIGMYAFSSCKKITNITIPDSVTSINSYAFSYCTGLTSITIPGSVEEIGNSAFKNCSSLISAEISSGVTTIGGSAFGYCSSLTSVTISNSVTIIGSSAFEYCSSLTNITIPNSVTTINFYAFRGCSCLTNVIIPSSATSISNIAFTGCDTEILTLYVEANSYALSYAEENGYNYVIYSSETKKFEMPKDGYGFANDPDSFGYSDGYYIGDDVYKMFMSATEFALSKKPGSPWGGYCYGMAATCLGFFEYDSGRTLYSNIFGLGTDNPFYEFDDLYDIPTPYGIDELDILTKWIEIFFTSQYSSKSQSIIFGDNYSCSENNWANMDSLIAAIENFAETGSDPIVLCLFSLISGEEKGHAVVPYDTEDNTETEGCYTVYIYDNNYPGATIEFYIYKDDSGFSHFEYDRYEYAISYIYEQDIYDIVYSACADSVSLAESSSSESAKIYVNSDNVSIVDSNGTSVENIDGAYEIFYMDSASDTRVFSVPYGDYTVKNNDSSLSELNVSVITSLDGKSISVGDNTATITLGVYDNGYTYIGANSSSNCNMEITTVNSSGQKKVIEADCTYLFVETTEPDAVYVKSSESTVYVNGASTKVSSLTGTALSTQDVSSGIIDIGTIILGDYDYYFEESGNTDLSCSDGKITGNICLNLYNNSGSSFSAVVVAAVYDSEGKLVYSENKSVTVGNNSNYISLKNLDIEASENDSYSCRVFLWKDMLSMRPITAPVDIEIS
ncbi:MAG: leucine-rich repeat protein [Clostridiales bacterium]|nr:leucine-rich repeat protein [Clostridiales bacterium]